MDTITPNYGLIKPDEDAFYSIKDFNDNMDKIDAALGNSTKFEKASGTGTAITLNGIVLEDGASKTFIASANNNGAATTINGKKLYKANTTETPNLKVGKAITLWYNAVGDCFFLQASATGNAVAANVLANKTFSNDDDTDIVGTIPSHIGGDDIPHGGYFTSNGTRIYMQPPVGHHFNGGSIYGDEPNLKPENMLAGKKYIGMDGGIPTMPTNGHGHYPSKNTAAGAYSQDGKNYAYLEIPPYSYTGLNSWAQSEQPDLRAENIVWGKNILGIGGTAKQLDGGINGVQRWNYAYAGQTINPGDFIKYQTGVAYVGAGTAQERSMIPNSNKANIPFKDSCVLDGTRVLVAYVDESSGSYTKLSVVSIDGVEFNAGTPFSYGTVGDTNSITLVALSPTKALIVYMYNNYMYGRVINISGTVITSVGPQCELYNGGTSTVQLFTQAERLNSIVAVDSTHAALFFKYFSGSVLLHLMNITVSGDNVTATSTWVSSNSVSSYKATFNEKGTKGYCALSSTILGGWTLSGATAVKSSNGVYAPEGVNSKYIAACGEDKLIFVTDFRLDGTNQYCYVWGIKVNHNPSNLTQMVLTGAQLLVSEHAPDVIGSSEVLENKIMLTYKSGNTGYVKARVITFDANANLTLYAETSRMPTMMTYTRATKHLEGGKTLLISANSASGVCGIIYNTPGTLIEFLNYVYETQVAKSINNDDIHGVALTYGAGGTSVGAGASHRDTIKVVSKV